MRQLTRDVSKLKEDDVINVLLYAIYKLTNDPEYSAISELAYVLDKDSLYKLCATFGGATIKIPPLSLFKNITKALLEGAKNTLKANCVLAEDIVVEIVPGSFELIFGCSQMVKHHTVDAVIAIGCVIRGDTPHFDYICQAVSSGISKINVEGDVPVIFGLLTTNSQEQAEERSGGILGNKGDEYAITALKMVAFAQKYK
mgnify:CR=1 FL=1